MPDREKVIAELEKEVKKTYLTKITIYKNGKKVNEDVTEHREPGIKMSMEMADEILAMLKEQEAKPPAIMQDVEGIWSTCSICGHKLRAILAMEMDTYFPKFCSECGQAVKWE